MTGAVGTSLESDCLKVQSKVGGKPHLRLNIASEPDSKQVPWGKVAKNFEERVQEDVKPLGSKQMELLKDQWNSVDCVTSLWHQIEWLVAECGCGQSMHFSLVHTGTCVGAGSMVVIACQPCWSTIISWHWVTDTGPWHGTRSAQLCGHPG